MGRSKRIWENYSMYCETSFIERGGTVACGVLPSLKTRDTFPYDKKPEFVSEHQGRAAFLLGQILMNYPDLTDQKTWFLQLMFVLCHDVGEIKNGDILDDGSVVDDAELQAMRREEEELLDDFFCNFPERYSLQMAEIAPLFEDYVGGYPLLDKMVEKLDAVLFQIFLYSKGVKGDVRRKKPHPSRRDMRFAEIIGSSSAIEVWAFHFRVAIKNAPEDFCKPLIKLLKTAFELTYGFLPNCMLISVDNVDLDDPADDIA
ncbi:HD domain-containing protein [Candidatus Saccharibacteria bacterium]|nr:HD domain-containing protein [Candidatus Saccharibacteria bacterium]